MAPSSLLLEPSSQGADVAAAVAEALATLGASPREGAWVLIVGCVDRRLARGLAGARVVMSDRATALSLPPGSFDLAVRVAGVGAAAELGELVVVRNALAGDAALLVVEAAHLLVAVEELAEVAGFSRRRARLLSSGFGVLELQR